MTKKNTFHIVGLILIFVLAMSALVSCDDDDDEEDMGTSSPTMTGDMEYEYTDLTPAEAKQMIDDNMDLIVIDVSPNYGNGHLPGAVNYYLGDGSLDEAIPMLDKDADYLVYCHVESVSRQGAQKLVDAGFMNVYRLDGDYSAWVAAGYPIEK